MNYTIMLTARTQEHADLWLYAMVHELTQRDSTKKPWDEVEAVVRSNLAYFAAHNDDECRERVERLYKCEHPIFGAFAKNGNPTPDEAFKAGQVAAEHGTSMARFLYETKALT